MGYAVDRLTILTSSDSTAWFPLYTWQSVQQNAEKQITLTTPIAATSVRILLAGAQQFVSSLPVLAVSELQVYGCEAFVSMSLIDAYTYSKAITPIVSGSLPARGSTAGGTAISLGGVYPVQASSVEGGDLTNEVSVTICGVECNVTAISSSSILCTTGYYGPTDESYSGIHVCPVHVSVSSVSLAVGGTYRYDDLWSRKTTWRTLSTPVPLQSDCPKMNTD